MCDCWPNQNQAQEIPEENKNSKKVTSRPNKSKAQVVILAKTRSQESWSTYYSNLKQRIRGTVKAKYGMN